MFDHMTDPHVSRRLRLNLAMNNIAQGELCVFLMDGCSHCDTWKRMRVPQKLRTLYKKVTVFDCAERSTGRDILFHLNHYHVPHACIKRGDAYVPLDVHSLLSDSSSLEE